MSPGRAGRPPEPDHAGWSHITNELLAAAPRMLRGEFLHAVLVVAGDPSWSAPRLSVYGCAEDVGATVEDELLAVYRSTSERLGLDVGQKFAIQLAWQTRDGPLSAHIAGAINTAFGITVAIDALIESARRRARARLGPRSFALGAVAAELERAHTLQGRGVPDARDTIAAAARARVDGRVSQYAAHVHWAIVDRPVVTALGFLPGRSGSARVDEVPFICERGAEREAATVLARAGDAVPLCTNVYVLAMDDADGTRRWVTADAEAALRFMHMTEVERLRALRRKPG